MTFALRRKEVVKDKPAITQIVQRRPALFSESQVSMPVLSIYKKWLTLCDPNCVVLRVIDFFHLTMGLYMFGYVLCFQVCCEFTRVVGKKSQRKLLWGTWPFLTKLDGPLQEEEGPQWTAFNWPFTSDKGRLTCLPKMTVSLVSLFFLPFLLISLVFIAFLFSIPPLFSYYLYFAVF